MADYKRAKDVAKFVREILKKEFPDTKFSVRTKTYSMGASINVHYWDGPPSKDVDDKIKHLQSVSHMDITDLVHYKESEYKGDEFHSGANHIFTVRQYSKGFLLSMAQIVLDLYKLELTIPSVVESEWGARFTEGHDKHYEIYPLWMDVPHGSPGGMGWTFPQLVDRHASITDANKVAYTDETEEKN